MKAIGRLMSKGELLLISNVPHVLLLKSKKQPLETLGGATAHHMFSVYRDNGCHQRQNQIGFISSKTVAFSFLHSFPLRFRRNTRFLTLIKM